MVLVEERSALLPNRPRRAVAVSIVTVCAMAALVAVAVPFHSVSSMLAVAASMPLVRVKKTSVSGLASSNCHSWVYHAFLCNRVPDALIYVFLQRISLLSRTQQLEKYVVSGGIEVPEHPPGMP